MSHRLDVYQLADTTISISIVIDQFVYTYIRFADLLIELTMNFILILGLILEDDQVGKYFHKLHGVCYFLSQFLGKGHTIYKYSTSIFKISASVPSQYCI